MKIKKNSKLNQPEISIIVPFWNEAENIPELIPRLISVMETLARNYELIFVDDGSTDQTWHLLEQAQNKNKQIVLIKLMRNFGQHAALLAGIEISKADIIITMDGDLQNNPEDIPILLKPLQEGYHVASGWRKHRQASFFKRRLPSLLVNRILAWISGIKLHDFGCALNAYRRETIQDLKEQSELRKFISTFAVWKGYRVAEVEVSDSKRYRGRSRYGFFQLLPLFFDFLVVFSKHPIQLLALLAISFFSILLGFGLIIGVSLYLIFYWQNIFWIHPVIFFFGLNFVFFGIGLFWIALISERVTRILQRLQNRPVFQIETVKYNSEITPL